MVSEITYNIKVSVETFYQEQYSKPLKNDYFFAYRVTIFNGSQHDVRLLRRHWFIFDSNGLNQEVEGEGVIGKKPLIAPNSSHQYISGCKLNTDMGKMHGTYLMERQSDNKQFFINIPEFKLITPAKLN